MKRFFGIFFFFIILLFGGCSAYSPNPNNDTVYRVYVLMENDRGVFQHDYKIDLRYENMIGFDDTKEINYVNQYSTLMEVIDHSKFGDLKTLQILVKLHSGNIIGVKTNEADERQESMDYDQLAEDLFG